MNYLQWHWSIRFSAFVLKSSEPFSQYMYLLHRSTTIRISQPSLTILAICLLMAKRWMDGWLDGWRTERKRHIEICKAWALLYISFVLYTYTQDLYTFKCSLTLYLYIWFWSFCIPFLNLLKILCEINQIVDVRFALALAFLRFIQQSCVQSNERVHAKACVRNRE